MPTNPTPTDQPDLRGSAREVLASALEDVGRPMSADAVRDEDDRIELNAAQAVEAMLTFATTIAAEARLQERERAARIARKHEAALRVARGWLITCSESAQARRDLKTLDEALVIRSSTGEG